MVHCSSTIVESVAFGYTDPIIPILDRRPCVRLSVYIQSGAINDGYGK